MGDFYQMFKEVLIPIFLKLFFLIEEEHFWNHFLRSTLPWLIPKPDNDTSKKKEKIQAIIPNGLTWNYSQYNISKINSTIE